MSLHSARLLLSLVAVLAMLGSSPSLAQTIFSESFSGETALDGTTPEVTADGATWVASPNFNEDGSFAGSPGSATLAFVPVDGLVYTLEASITGISGTGAWIALGFASGQSAFVKSPCG